MGDYSFSTIQLLPPKKMVGKSLEMSFAQNKTVDLWRSFMPHRQAITNEASKNFYSIQLYPPSFFTNFNPTTLFTKWACVEVNNFDIVPAGMQTLQLDGGLYTIFNYKGNSSNVPAAFTYIFQQWLPASKYVLDHRPHFEILGPDYQNNDPDSQEQIFIPIQDK